MLNSKEFLALSPEQQQVVQAVYEELTGKSDSLAARADTAEADYDPVHEVFDLLEPCRGCVPDGYSEDLYVNIRKKISAVYNTARTLACRKLFARDSRLTVVIDVSVEDDSEVAIVDRERAVCYVLDDFAVWNMEYETFPALVEEVENIRDAICAVFHQYASVDGRDLSNVSYPR